MIGDTYEHQLLACIDCGQSFSFSQKDIEFYAAQQYTPPKRCKPCRAKKKARFEAAEARTKA